MKRLFGLMPVDEVTIEKKYKTDFGIVTIQAGSNGYSVIFGDNSSQYKDIVDSAEKNFQRAYEIAKEVIKSDLFCEEN